MKNFLAKLFGNLPDQVSTWKYHLWASLFCFLTLSTFGWQPIYFYRTLYLIQRYPLHLVPNWVLTISISFLLAFFIRKKIIHFCVLFTVFLVFAMASRMKFESLGFPLLAMDLSLVKYSDLLFEYISPAKIFGILLSLVVPIVLLNFRYKGRPSLYSKLLQHPILLRFERRSLLCFLLAIPIWHGLITKAYFAIGGMILSVTPQSPLDDYMGDGDVVALALSMYSNQNHVKKYNLRPETLEKLNALVGENQLEANCNPRVRPDILVVMVESMFDPIQIPTIKFTQDPLGPIRNLGFEESKSFLFVPSYGGNTANTEFEFLTGSTHRFFPLGTIQYQHHLYTPANSLPQLLKDKNYHSMAIHNYQREFWRRHEVYPLLGFEEFYGLEDLNRLTDVPYYTKLKPQDKVLATFVPDQMKKHYDEPGFYFVVTMGTHGPYIKYLPNSKNKITLNNSSDIEDRTVDLLTNYTNFLADSSDVLSDLFRSALGRSKPTMVVFFGDHLPALPAETYSKTGYLDWMRRELGIEANEQKVVPVHVLNNFGCKISLPKTIATNCIASHLIAQIFPDLPKDQFWKYNREFCRKHPLLFDGIDPAKLDGDFADYAALIYKNLFEWNKAK